MKKAFSLVELLISLIIISVIVTAFVPIITKKGTKNLVFTSSGGGVTNECSDTSCVLCNKKECLLCNKTCASDEFLNVKKCLCEKCSTKFGECTTCSAKACSTCKPGYGFYGSDKCVICPIGTFSSESQCKKCPKGTFTAYTGRQFCNSCAPGTYNDTEGNYKCKDCPDGTSAYGTGNTQCTDCAPGTFSNEHVGRNGCTQCPEGTFNSGSRMSSCKACPAGTSTNNQKGSTSCSDCTVGTFSNTIRSAACTLCAQNTYNDLVGQVKCKVCPVGYRSNPGASVCTPCGANEICANGNAAKCPDGQFSNAGDTSCKSCSNFFGTNCKKCVGQKELSGGYGCAVADGCSAPYRIMYGKSGFVSVSYCVPSIGSAPINISHVYSGTVSSTSTITLKDGSTKIYFINIATGEQCGGHTRCCWFGGIFKNNSNMLCNYAAADAICKVLGTRLMNYNDRISIPSSFLNSYILNTKMCTHQSTINFDVGVTSCPSFSGCKANSNVKECLPGTFWAGNSNTSFFGVSGDGNFSFYPSEQQYTVRSNVAARTVRCIL